MIFERYINPAGQARYRQHTMLTPEDCEYIKKYFNSSESKRKKMEHPSDYLERIKKERSFQNQRTYSFYSRVRKLTPEEVRYYTSHSYRGQLQQRQYAWGLGFLRKGLGKTSHWLSSASESVGNLNTKINNAGGTGGVFRNIGSNITTGFENAGAKIKNWWNSGKGAYETSSMYNARMRSGVGPQQAQTKEYKSIFTPKQQPEKITLDVSAEKKNAFNSHTDGTIKSADSATAVNSTPQQPKPEPQNINSSGGATDQSVMKQNTGVSNATNNTVTPQLNPEQKSIVGSANGSANNATGAQTPDPVKNIGKVPQSANIDNPAGATFSEQNEFPTRRLFTDYIRR